MEQVKKIPARSEIPAEDKWAIEDLFVSDEAWKQELATLEQASAAMAAYEGRLAESAKTLYEYLQQVEQVDVKADRLGNYCFRRSDEDTRDSDAQAMSGKYMAAVVALSAASSFATPEIMAIDEQTLQGFYASCPELERYRRYLTDLRRRKAHTLSAQEERLLAAAGEMAQAPDTIYGSFADADISFADAVDGEGNRHPLTQGTFVSLEESQDRVLRRSAYENLYDGFAGFKNTAAALLNAQNKQLKFFADARKYDNALDASLDATNVPTAVYHNLIDAVHQNMDKMHRYVRLRKKLLGVDELHFYDVYTPLMAEVDRRIPYAEAKQTVYDALAPLGKEYQAILKEGFENRWIDVYQNQGKRSGAYSAGAKVHPFVLLNYTGTLDSQFTLAHEMGHAIHSYLSNRTQNPIDSDYVIFVAEVASTCNESLLIHNLLNKTEDKDTRAFLINHFLEQFKGTLYRQTMFAEFEKITHDMVWEGETLTADKLCEIYYDLNKFYFGEDIVLDEEIALEWARIPHFYNPFYVYQYATGISAAIALSRKIMKEGETGVKDYMKFLTGGGSKDPIDLLKLAGVDMTGKEPVRQALKLFKELLNEMESIVG